MNMINLLGSNYNIHASQDYLSIDGQTYPLPTGYKLASSVKSHARVSTMMDGSSRQDFLGERTEFSVSWKTLEHEALEYLKSLVTHARRSPSKSVISLKIIDHYDRYRCIVLPLSYSLSWRGRTPYYSNVKLKVQE